MYLHAVKYNRVLFWAILVAGFLAFLWPAQVPLWLPLGLAGVWLVVFAYVVLYPRQTRRLGWRCPACGWVPFALRAWQCKKCHEVWDSFTTDGACPHCGHQHDETACLRCRQISPNWQWHVPNGG